MLNSGEPRCRFISVLSAIRIYICGEPWPLKLHKGFSLEFSVGYRDRYTRKGGRKAQRLKRREKKGCGQYCEYK